ncbi:MAG: hypothetical protein IJI45_05530 [Anaerolineaceae bacterium]|nr:hypothetical protein [Anaerolineaceae bacterium]
MNNDEEITIIRGDVSLKRLNEPIYEWSGYIHEDLKLVFEKAFEIQMNDRDEGIVDCVFTVNDRTFEDNSWIAGRTIQKFPDDYYIRIHEDGTKFLFTHSVLPTFDYYDRLWASRCQIAVYCDDFGINMIQCFSGYKLGRISIYLNLVKSIPAFTEWLEKLGCADRLNDPTIGRQ